MLPGQQGPQAVIPEDYLELADDRYDEAAIRALPAPDWDEIPNPDLALNPDPVLPQQEDVGQIRLNPPPLIPRAIPLVPLNQNVPAPRHAPRQADFADDSPQRLVPPPANGNAVPRFPPPQYAHIPIEQFYNHPQVVLNDPAQPAGQLRPEEVALPPVQPDRQEELHPQRGLFPEPPQAVTRSGRVTVPPNRYQA